MRNLLLDTIQNSVTKLSVELRVDDFHSIDEKWYAERLLNQFYNVERLCIRWTKANDTRVAPRDLVIEPVFRLTDLILKSIPPGNIESVELDAAYLAKVTTTVTVKNFPNVSLKTLSLDAAYLAKSTTTVTWKNFVSLKTLSFCGNVDALTPGSLKKFEELNLQGDLAPPSLSHIYFPSPPHWETFPDVRMHRKWVEKGSKMFDLHWSEEYIPSKSHVDHMDQEVHREIIAIKNIYHNLLILITCNYEKRFMRALLMLSLMHLMKQIQSNERFFSEHFASCLNHFRDIDQPNWSFVHFLKHQTSST